MARFNEVMLNGIIEDDPDVRYNKPKNDPDRMPILIRFRVTVVRGIRHYGAMSDKLKHDAPTVFSVNPVMIEQMRDWKKGDNIEIHGTLASMDTVSKNVCPDCHEIDKKKSTLTYVNPIFARRIYVKSEDEEAEKKAVNYVVQCAEISNRVRLMGHVYGDTELHRTSKGLGICNYKLAVDRKYRIIGEYENHYKDFVIVKSYGKIADSDNNTLKDDSFVFIDGMLQVRYFKEEVVCPYCGKTHELIRSVTEVVPYSTEYLDDTARKESEVRAVG